jgi:glycosyltransferase involved in cell wall biosynthesis
MTIKVLMTPHLNDIGSAVSGIHTVIRKYFQHLPQFGIELVDPDAITFDLRAAHAGITGGEAEICHCHGLYWCGDVPCDEWEWHVNSRVIEAIRNAKEITVPSVWVNETFKRDLRKPAHVIPHGVDWDEWQHKEPNQGYVLWNKNRNNSDVVSNSILDILIPRFRDVTFVSTFTTPNLSKLPHNMWPNNFKIIETGGKTPYEQMKLYTQGAGVYLSTSKETFGISVLESLASGVPVLGWDWGGNSQLVQHGVNGYLAKPGDVDDLCEGLNYCIKHRKVLGSNGRELAKQWTWQRACELVAGVYRLTMAEDVRPMKIPVELYQRDISGIQELHQANV